VRTLLALTVMVTRGGILRFAALLFIAFFLLAMYSLVR